MAIASVPEAIAAFKTGETVIIVDDEDRENEGDLAIAADFVTPEAVNFFAKEGRGLICCAMAPALVDKFGLPLMVPQTENRSGFGTAFTVSVEAAEGVSTGISAFDRAHTIQTLINQNASPADIVTPGHTFPLRAAPGGVLERDGQTEASVDLAALAGLTPAAMICEIMDDDGSMARLPSLTRFAAHHNLKIVTVKALQDYRRANSAGENILRAASQELRMTRIYEGDMNAAGLKIAIVSTRWNDFIVDRLTAGAKDALVRHGLSEDNIELGVAPGAYEVPLVARTFAQTGRYDGVLALGCVIRGATPHFDYVAGEAASGVAAVSRETGVPVAFGVLTVDTIEQAIERAGTKAGNKGAEAALALVETINLCKSIKEA